jgi:hypothetical protein
LFNRKKPKQHQSKINETLSKSSTNRSKNDITKNSYKDSQSGKMDYNNVHSQNTTKIINKRVNCIINPSHDITPDKTTDNAVSQLDNKKEMVNHPSHYNMGKYECIEVVKELVRDMKGIEPVLFFNAFKYLWRYKQKNGLQDLEKCEFYLKELIKLNKIT